MDEYRKPYMIMMNASEDALRAMDAGDCPMVRDIFIRAQQSAEEVLLERCDRQ